MTRRRAETKASYFGGETKEGSKVSSGLAAAEMSEVRAYVERR